MNPERRGTYLFNFKKWDVDSLEKLSSKLNLSTRYDLRKYPERILSILTEKVDQLAIVTLAHFYDPHLCCFTFTYFQLEPTFEEFERIVGRSLKKLNHFPKFNEEFTPKKIALALSVYVQVVLSNWDIKGTFKGFSRRFLEDLAMEFEKTDNWKAFNVVMALLIHGVMLYPNIDNFMDQIVVEIFLFGNPIPFLLGDIYYSLHERHGKKGGTLLCCAPLLHAWIMTHLKEDGHIFSKELKWSQKLGSITANNIKWYIRYWETIEIIIGCGDFPNVPL
ncbi:uncharacterized protein LOC127131090 [Lathyrus oleraceus]|uniref:uncharacterized protein LOC127131090 n=1 Tax=Pisum sativum TaxID=3888 RepID=UPI0021D278C4|nr:uncharacterized protein LOC127131090 [Pisum sativum]